MLITYRPCGGWRALICRGNRVRRIIQKNDGYEPKGHLFYDQLI